MPALSPWRPLSNAGHPVSRTAWQGTTGHSTQPGTVSLQPQSSPNELCIGMLSSGGADTFSPTTGWDVLTPLGAPLMASYRPTQPATS